MTFTILITTSGSVTAQGVIKGLRKQQEFSFRVITIDIIDNTPGRYLGDAFYKVSNENSPSYIPELLDICKKENVNVLIPIYDKELLVVAEHKKEFHDIGCTVIVSDPQTIRTCNDKYKTYEFFNEHHVPTPKTVRAEDILFGKAALPYPVFLKPSRGVSAIDTYTINDRNELELIAKKVKDPLVQEKLDGVEYSIDLLADLKGVVIGMVPRTREEKRQGASIKGVTVKDERMMEWAARIATLLDIIGPCNIQCFKDTQGNITFFEVNPRFSATHAHTIASGMNTPHLLLKMLAGQLVEPMIGQFQEGLRMYRYWSEVFADRDGNRMSGDTLL